MNPEETYEKIIGVLREKGPSLPINLAKALSISSLFISAFLSELTNQKRIKVSSLKVGGSPLYYLDGQHEKLEDYHKYLHPREAEAYLLLREHRVLKDRDQDPVVRVALRAIKDFSIGFRNNEEVYWRYFNIGQNEVDEILNGSKGEIKLKEKEVIPEKEVIQEEEADSNEETISETEIVSEKELVIDEEEVVKPEREVRPIEVKLDNKFNNPLIIEGTKKKEKPKSEFAQKVIDFIDDRGLNIIEEKDHKAKEYNCIVEIKSELGTINFFTQAKDKKTITEGDFKKLLSRAQSIPLPAFMIYTGEISKKAKDYLKGYSSVLKAKRIPS